MMNIKNKIVMVLAVCMCTAGTLLAQEKLTFEQCLEKARTNNRSLQNAALDMRSSSELRKEMRAKYYPEISANVMAFHAFDKIIKADGTYPEELASLADINPAFGQLAGQPYSFHELNRAYSASLSITQPIYAGGQITASNKLAKIDSEVNELQYSLKEKEVVQKVTENYWQIAQIHYNLQTIAAAEKQLAALYDEVNSFVETGVTTRNALLKVKLRRQELASNRLSLENSSHILTLLLAQQIGMGSKPVVIIFPEVEASIVMPEKHGLTGDSYNREELRLAAKSVEAGKLQVKLERGKNLPTLAVGLMGYNSKIGGLSQTVKSNMGTSMTNALGLATLSIPISSWFGGTHSINRNKIKLEQSKNDYLDIQEKLIIDTESAWYNLEESYKQIEIARVSVEEAKENLRMSTDQYTVGKETITDLLDAETLNRQAQGQLSSAIADYHIRYADYLRKIK